MPQTKFLATSCPPFSGFKPQYQNRKQHCFRWRVCVCVCVCVCDTVLYAPVCCSTYLVCQCADHRVYLDRTDKTSAIVFASLSKTNLVYKCRRSIRCAASFDNYKQYQLINKLRFFLENMHYRILLSWCRIFYA